MDSIYLVDHTSNGRCSNCGECCSDILHLSTQEIKDIDMFLKTHKVRRNNTSTETILNTMCPFRNQLLKKCDIYPVRPYICQVFKCDTPPEKAIVRRDLINKNRKPRSMTELFFKDDIVLKYVEAQGIKLYRRGE